MVAIEEKEVCSHQKAAIKEGLLSRTHLYSINLSLAECYWAFL
jgi:hypothetical protein